MSKITSADTSSDYPTFSSGSVSINGTPVATTKYSDGSLKSNYNMNDNEKAIYDYAQSTLAGILPQLNVFSAETQNSLQSQLDAYKNKGLETIDKTYSPMIKSLENEVASRFGNFDNSMFMDKLETIESNRADAMSAFVQDMIAKESNLTQSELDRRYAYADFLNGLQNQSYANAMSAINTSLGSSSNANSYNNSLYNTLYKQSSQSSSNVSDVTSLLSRAMGLTSGSFYL